MHGINTDSNTAGALNETGLTLRSGHLITQGLSHATKVVVNQFLTDVEVIKSKSGNKTIKNVEVVRELAKQIKKVKWEWDKEN